jgi:YVTN family beta-propeller protein
MRTTLRVSSGWITVAALCISALLGAQAAFASTATHHLPYFVKNISLGTAPQGVGVNPETNRIYVADSGGGGGPDNDLFVINGKTNTVITTIFGFNAPKGVAVNSETNRIYVTNIGNNSISVVDGKTNTITIPAITVGSSPGAVAVNERTNRIYVANSVDNTISVIDGKTNSVTATIFVGVGADPVAIAADPETNRVYVANISANTVSVIAGKTNSVIATIPGFASPGGVAVNSKTNRVYVPNFSNGTLTVLDGVTFHQAIIPIAGNDELNNVAVNEEINRVYVTADSSPPGSPGEVIVLNGATRKTGATVVTTITVGTDPFIPAANPETGQVYVSNLSSKNVSVIQDEQEDEH